MKTIDALTDKAMTELEQLEEAAHVNPNRFAASALDVITRLSRMTHKSDGWLTTIGITDCLVIHQMHAMYIEN